MATLGGKLGFAVWFIAGAALVFPMVDLTMGHCFYEQGCDPFETLKLGGSIIAAFVLAVPIGLLARAIIKRLFERSED